MGPHTLHRTNQLSLTARYERKRFELSIPYSFYNYVRQRIGLSIRYGVLTIGTDMLGPFTGLSDAYGLNFYFGVRWQQFEKCTKKQK